MSLKAFLQAPNAPPKDELRCWEYDKKIDLWVQATHILTKCTEKTKANSESEVSAP